jgi:thiosulfate/3-mercaptopyruvate sulfurtransferase
MNNTLVRDFDQVRANIASRTALVLDARSPGRFNGTEREPRPGLRAGHIPGSVNLPHGELFDPADKTIRPASALRERLASRGVHPGRPVITTCGSGISASALAFALHLIGHKDVAVYDGSWAEWGGRPDAPIEV